MTAVNLELASELQETVIVDKDEDPEEINDIDSDEQFTAINENPSDPDGLVDDMDEDDLLLDESLSPLEKIFLFAKSDLIFHRVFIAKELPTLIRDIEISEAVEYVVPLMNSLEELVKEAFAPELDKIIWFYYSHCPLRELSPENGLPETSSIPLRPQTPLGRPQTPLGRPQTPLGRPLTPLDRPQTPQTPNESSNQLSLPYLSVSAFTPLLQALLLDQNSNVSAAAQSVVYSLVEKILAGPDINPKEKELLTKETLEEVVLGIGRLDQEKSKRDDEGDLDKGDDNSFGGMNGGEEEVELGRMIMMTLIASLASLVGPELCVRLFVPEMDRMIEEPEFYVRREAALAIGGLASVVPLDAIIDKLAERAVRGIDLFARDVSKSVKSTAGEIIGELITTFQTSGKVPESLVQHFLSLGPGRDASGGSGNAAYGGLGARDPEKPARCAYNFPAIVLTLGPSRWDDLKETYSSLTRDVQVKVRRSLACSLHEIARVIGPEKTQQDLMRVFAEYTHDIDEVKSGVLKNMVAFIECLPESSRNEYLPEIIRVWNGVEHQWRLRDEIAKQLPALCELYDAQHVVNHILPLTIRAIQDKVASVRETAVATFSTLFRIAKHDDACYNQVRERVKQFATEYRFRERVSYVQICSALMSNGFPNSEFETHFLPILETLVSDQVVNVRIAVARLVSDLCQTGKPFSLTWQAYGNIQIINSSNPILPLIQTLSRDTDVNVRLFVFPFLSPEERESILSYLQPQSFGSYLYVESSRANRQVDTDMDVDNGDEEEDGRTGDEEEDDFGGFEDVRNELEEVDVRDGVDVRDEIVEVAVRDEIVEVDVRNEKDGVDVRDERDRVVVRDERDERKEVDVRDKIGDVEVREERDVVNVIMASSNKLQSIRSADC
ncbi:10969_t:CDS:10 [Paraglomus occultum]|uniref:10969_t:CDS:1 n=1 Tax=Paraglomus occultum TaxID=144539 RepID=A0A9N9A602_9GLOM|nr:10969_t:CDS:10 [Paraglomus occultum]